MPPGLWAEIHKLKAQQEVFESLIIALILRQHDTKVVFSMSELLDTLQYKLDRNSFNDSYQLELTQVNHVETESAVTDTELSSQIRTSPLSLS